MYRDIHTTMLWDIVMMSLTVSLLYSLSPILYKYIGTIHPYKIHTYTLLLISSSVFFGCALLCCIIHNEVVTHDVKQLFDNKHALLILILSSLLSVFIANLLYFNVLQRSNTKTYMVVALVFTAPLFTMLISYMFLQEEITYYALVGVCLIVAGCVTLSVL